MPSKIQTTLLTTLTLATLSDAHGYFVSPLGRQPGPHFAAACSQQAYYNMVGSIYSHIQGLQQVVATQSDYHAEACNLWMCKGMKYADNTGNVRTYTPGQEVDLYHPIVAPHTGYANVSIVSTATNTVLVANLSHWDVYASNAVPKVTSQENFTVTMPTGLGGRCATAGECVIQMFWNAESVRQTYESCIDFTMGSGSQWRHARGWV
ncbi:Lytic polysaccharide mono-oxygenase, cellulose-degrading [Teratosphaeria destructans]|uniref:Lytic polysaccharide mono-oxygenase, cellulose-degrading n=1 Tax=Teratosphaeria destructans TaxID=418781 RepID=A0A9W7SJH5_9PEZI|nr:Lytic polysaccharide mono-oxygenase, cellulose-degrading [Teratosphaeria destructans]